MTNQASESRTVRVLFLTHDHRAPLLTPLSTEHNVNLDVMFEQEHLGNADPYKPGIGTGEQIARLTSTPRFDLVVIQNNRGAGLMKAAHIADAMKPKTIIFWRQAPEKWKQDHYARLGFTHFCTPENLWQKAAEVLELGVIRVTLKRTWEMIDFSKPLSSEQVEVPAGSVLLERIPNPHGHPGNCLVLKGTMIGMAESAWLTLLGRRANPAWEIILMEDGQVVRPVRK